MIINTKHYLITYKEFLKQVDSLKEFKIGTYHSENVTEKEHAGWDKNLYQVSTLGCYVIYSQTREWTYHFNGTEGTGLTLEEALSKFTEKYNQL